MPPSPAGRQSGSEPGLGGWGAPALCQAREGVARKAQGESREEKDKEKERVAGPRSLAARCFLVTRHFASNPHKGSMR